MIEEPDTDNITIKSTSIWWYVVIGIVLGFGFGLFEQLSRYNDWPQLVRIFYFAVKFSLFITIAFLKRNIDQKVVLMTKNNPHYIKRIFAIFASSMFGLIVALAIDQNFGDY